MEKVLICKDCPDMVAYYGYFCDFKKKDQDQRELTQKNLYRKRPEWCPLQNQQSESQLLDNLVECIENLGFGESRALPFCIESFPELVTLLAEYKKLKNR